MTVPEIVNRKTMNCPVFQSVENSWILLANIQFKTDMRVGSNIKTSNGLNIETQKAVSAGGTAPAFYFYDDSIISIEPAADQNSEPWFAIFPISLSEHDREMDIEAWRQARKHCIPSN